MDKLTDDSFLKLGDLEVATTANKGHDPEFWAHQLTNKICGISEQAPEHIRQQALAFKNYIYARISNIDYRSKRVINKRIAEIIPLNLDYKNLELMEILEDDKSNLNIILLAQSFSLVYSNSKEIPNKFDEIDQSSLDREFRSNYNFLKIV